MNYQKIYNALIDRARSSRVIEFRERHHVIPKCLGGSNEKDNIVSLTPEEHFLAHLLLVKIYPGNSKIVFAANMMSVRNGQQKRISNKRYGWVKKLLKIAASENGKKNKGKKKSLEVINKIKNGKIGTKNPMFGKFGKDHPTYGMCRKGQGKGTKKKGNFRYCGTPESEKRQSETKKRNLAPSFNVSGYEILTPTGFQPFEGVDYSGLVHCLNFTTNTGKTITVSKKHRFDESEKQARDYQINDTLHTKDGIETIISIVQVGKKQVFDILEVNGNHLYYANDIVNHNCEVLVDDNYAIIPEFSKTKKTIVMPWDRKPFYDGYVAMDIGVKDLTVVLFAWFDFIANKIIVEDEFVLNGQKFNTNALAEGIRKKESEVFTDKITGEQIDPCLRVSDTSLTVINDLWISYALRFQPTRKDDADAALNKVRMMIQNEQIIIHPRCKTLIMHLEAGVWNKAKTSFERSAEGHFDAIDALKYLVRNVNLTRNPYPSGYLDKFDQNKQMRWSDPAPQGNSEWEKVFNIKKPKSSEKTKEIVQIFNKPIKRF